MFKRRILSIYLIYLLITLGFIGIVVFETTIDEGCVKAAIIYVDSTGGSQYTTIQAAIDNAIPGDTIIVANGTYYESVTVNKTNIKLIGNSTTDCKIIHYYVGTNWITDYASGINVTASGVNITGFNISVSGNYTFGIYLNSTSPNSNIIDNNITAKGNWSHGILLYQSSNNNITNNHINISGRFGYGIYLLSSATNNNLINNIINVSGLGSCGIYLLQSWKNNLINNTINIFNVSIYGIYLSTSPNNNLTGNTINTNGLSKIGIWIYSFSNNNNLTGNIINTFGLNVNSIRVWSSSTNNLIGNIINVNGQNGKGIDLLYAVNNNLKGNTIDINSGNGCGIYLYLSSNKNNLTDNIINCTGQNVIGISLGSNSNENNLIENTIEVKGQNGMGIRTFGSEYNNMIDNRINTSMDDSFGIYMWWFSNYFNVTNNNINTEGKNSHGIYINLTSFNNSLAHNVVKTSGTGAHGIFIKNSNNSIISNCKSITTGSNAHGFFLNGLIATLVNTTISTGTNSYDIKAINDGKIISINCSFNTVHLIEQGGGILKVKNYIEIQVLKKDGVAPLSWADVEVKDNNIKIYATADYGGIDPPTSFIGRIKQLIVTDRWYFYSNTAIENTTAIKVKKEKDLNWEEVRSDVDMSTSHTEIFIVSDFIVPQAPTGLKIIRVPRTNTLNISWNPNLNTHNYTLYDNKSRQWQILINITHPQNWTLDKDLQDESEYYYRIQAWNKGGLPSELSLVESYYLTDIIPPTIPNNLNVKPVPNGDALNISWDLNIDDTKYYDIWWEDPVNNDWAQLVNISHPKNYFILSNASLINGTTYKFKIRAWDKVTLHSNFTDPVETIHRDYIPPEPPINLVAKTLSETSIELFWKPNMDIDVKGYLILINQSGVGSCGPYKLKAEVNTSTYEVTDLVENTVFYFVVQAIDEANNTSPFSEEAWNITIAAPERPRIVDTTPAHNSKGVAVNSPVTITFSIPMNTSSVSSVLSISPSIDYNLSWSDGDTVLQITFTENLSYNTTYNITIGAAKATTGVILEDAPFILNFRTNVEIITLTITISYPTANTKVKPGDMITVSGSSTGLAEGTQVTVSLAGKTVTGSIGADGTWSVIIKAPDTEGNYTIEVKVGDHSDSVSIIVEDDGGKVDDTGDDDTKDMTMLYVSIFIVVLVVLIVIIAIFFLMRKKKTQEEAVEEEWEDEE